MYSQKKSGRSAFLTALFLNGGIATANHLSMYQKLPEGKRSILSFCISFFYLCSNIQINAGKSILGNKIKEIHITILGVLRREKSIMSKLLVFCILHSSQNLFLYTSACRGLCTSEDNPPHSLIPMLQLPPPNFQLFYSNILKTIVKHLCFTSSTLHESLCFPHKQEF